MKAGNTKDSNATYWHRIIMLSILCLFAFSFAFSVKPKGKKGRAVTQKTDTRVYLQHADELKYDVYGDHPDAQFVKGSVSFMHKGMHLTCDSAYYYENTNSFDAYGHVKMRQGDTLTLVSDKAYYDGNDEMAHAWHNVVLTHRESKLYCDTLDYDRMYGIADAYGAEGIKLTRGKDVLTADWGRHFTDNSNTRFYYNVILTNDNGLRIETDTLDFFDKQNLAHVTGPSVITQKDTKILTEDGYYNTKSEASKLFGRSTVYEGAKSITADSLYHDDHSGFNEGYGNVVYNDTVNKNMLLGEFVKYNDKVGEGFGTDRAVIVDYSQGDTLWVHGDTIRIHTIDINTDSVRREVYCYPHVRAYRSDMQAVCDSLVYHSVDSCMTMYKDPIIWTQGSQLLGEVVHVYFNDSTVRYAEVLSQALSVEPLSDSIHFNQISSTDMRAYFVDGKVRENWAVANVQLVYYPIDENDSTIIGLNYTETDTMKMYILPNQKMERIWMSKNTGVLYPITQAPADKEKLPNFAWFDYMRPLSKEDIFNWRPKKSGTELKAQKRREAPRRRIEKKEETVEKATDEEKAEKATKEEIVEKVSKEEKDERNTNKVKEKKA